MVTIAVKSLDRAREFYEKTLGFTPGVFYEPTRWQSYAFEGNSGFGIIEKKDLKRENTGDIINFRMEKIEEYWQAIKGKVEVESAPGRTPWGSYKFIIKDPDGFRLGFLGKER